MSKEYTVIRGDGALPFSLVRYHLADKFSCSDLAEAVAMARRELDRVKILSDSFAFPNEDGTGPRMRLMHAAVQALLEEEDA